jgi:chromosome segregation ATPase
LKTPKNENQKVVNNFVHLQPRFFHAKILSEIPKNKHNIMPNKKQKKETQFPENQVMMMFESMQDGIDVIAESQKQLIQNQNELKDNLENFKFEIKGDLLDFKMETRENFEKVNQHLKKHDQEFKKVNQHLKKHDQEFKKVFTSLAEIKQEIQDIRKELNQMKNQPVIRREEFELLVKRVERVEMSIER